MSTSYLNPGGSGERRNLNIGAWYEYPNGSTANFTGGAHNFLCASTADLNYQNAAGEVRICFDFMEPRVIDAFKLFHSGGGTLGELAIVASHDGLDWIEVRPPEVKNSSASGTEFAFTNETAYRFYALYRPSGNGSTSPYFWRIEFSIDDATDSRWWKSISYGNRDGLVSVTGDAWIYYESITSGIIRVVNAWQTVADASIAAGKTAGAEITITFAAAECITGFRLCNAIDGALWHFEGRADPADPWTRLASDIALQPTWERRYAPASSNYYRFTECTFENNQAFKYYRLVVASGTTTTGIAMGGLTFRAGIPTSFSNPDGSGERRGLTVMPYIEVPDGSLAGWLGEAERTIGVYPALMRQNAEGPCRIVYDFLVPRLVDAIRLKGTNGIAWGPTVFAASHNGIDWITLASSAGFNTSSSTPFQIAFANTTAYRYYSIERPIGAYMVGYWDATEFQIDEAPDLGWYDEYSAGQRAAIISVAGTVNRVSQFASVVNNWTLKSLSNARFWVGRGVGSYVDFTLAEPRIITGLRFSLADDGAVWCVKARNSAADPWVTLAENISLTPDWGPTAEVENRTTLTYMSFAEALWDNETPYTIYRLEVQFGVTGPNDVRMGQMVFRVGPYVPPPILNINVSSGSVEIIGHRPKITGAETVTALPGSLHITGRLPSVVSTTRSDPTPGSLTITGKHPSVADVTLVYPSGGSLVISGHAPIIYTDSGTLASQLVVAALGDEGTPSAASSQLVVAALGGVIPQARSSQFLVAALVEDAPCVSERCQLWTIQRRDGVIFRYTSLDVDFWYKGHRYKACGSMDPSAAQTGSALGDTGSVSLSGLITDDGISEADLFGGLFDDAFVTIDLVNWTGPSRKPRRIGSGWVGKVTHGPAFHTMEILSASARLEQTALVQLVSPSCRWRFGDSRCSVNAEAMKIPATVVRLANRGDMILDVETPPDDGRIWKSGRLRFTTGPAAGIDAEYKEINFTTGQVILWTPAGLAPMPGDTVEILPGCDLTRDGGCRAYNNIINFGGYPDVPGTDSAMETPDAKL